jgi:hypothetical protein
MMKKITLSCFALISASICLAQSELHSFTVAGNGAVTTFATDYQTLGINPANLGWSNEFQNKTIAFGVMDFGFSLHSEALASPLVRKGFQFNPSAASLQDKIDMLEVIADNGIYFSADVSWMGFSLNTEKFGGFAVSVRDRMQSSLSFNGTSGDIFILGYNATYFDQKFDENNNPTTDPDKIDYGVASNPKTLAELFDGTAISFNWVREFNIGYGKRVYNTDLLSLYAGIGLKYIQGIGVLDIRADGENFTAFSSFDKDFGLDYKKIYQEFLGANADNNNVPTGKGAGVDLGFNAVLLNKIKFGIALNGAGSVTWEGNALEVDNKKIDTTYFSGLNSPNIFAQVGDIVGEEGLFQWKETDKGGKTISTPATLRIGTSYQHGKLLEVGMDVTLPMNKEVPGSMAGGIFGLGATFKPLPWLRFSTGYVTGADYKNKIPVGLVFIKGLGIWESGIASRDIVSLFKENGTTISVVTGFLRFRI